MPLLQPPSVPAPPPPPGSLPVGVQSGVTEIPLDLKPLSSADVDALKAKRNELSRQLTSVQSRRDDVAKELRRTTAESPSANGLEQRLAVMDERIVQLERDIAANGRELARAPGELVNEEATAVRYGPFSSGQLTAISMVSIVMVLGPLAWAAARMMLKRANQPKPSAQLLEGTARLERIEQAVDAMSIEIERISEGQRFVTQLMSSKAPALVERAEPGSP